MTKKKMPVVVIIYLYDKNSGKLTMIIRKYYI